MARQRAGAAFAGSERHRARAMQHVSAVQTDADLARAKQAITSAFGAAWMNADVDARP